MKYFKGKLKVMDSMGGDEELTDQVIEIFLTGHIEQIEKVRGAFEQREREPITRELHSLKGILANFGNEEFIANVQNLEDRSREEDLDSINKEFENLVGMIEVMVDEIKGAA